MHLNTLSYTCLKHFPKFASSLHFEFSLSHNFLDGQCDVVDQVLTGGLLLIVTCAGCVNWWFVGNSDMCRLFTKC